MARLLAQPSPDWAGDILGQRGELGRLRLPVQIKIVSSFFFSFSFFSFPYFLFYIFVLIYNLNSNLS